MENEHEKFENLYNYLLYTLIDLRKINLQKD